MRLRDLHPYDRIAYQPPIKQRLSRPDGTICFTFEDGTTLSGWGDDEVNGTARDAFKPPIPTPPIGNTAFDLTPLDWSSM